MERFFNENINHTKRKGTTLIEMLLVLSILSVSMYPLVYIINIAVPPKINNDDEYMATLLAHHVIETIVARRAKDPYYLPQMCQSTPVVSTEGAHPIVNEYFANIAEYNGPITSTNEPQLYWSLNKFNCHADTYYLDENMFKIIVYVTYQKDGRTMKVFFERLLPLEESVDNFDEEEL